MRNTISKYRVINNVLSVVLYCPYKHVNIKVNFSKVNRDLALLIHMKV